jgi:hypothetical protein
MPNPVLRVFDNGALQFKPVEGVVDIVICFDRYEITLISRLVQRGVPDERSGYSRFNFAVLAYQEAANFKMPRLSLLLPCRR